MLVVVASFLNDINFVSDFKPDLVKQLNFAPNIKALPPLSSTLTLMILLMLHDDHRERLRSPSSTCICTYKRTYIDSFFRFSTHTYVCMYFNIRLSFHWHSFIFLAYKNLISFVYAGMITSYAIMITCYSQAAKQTRM